MKPTRILTLVAVAISFAVVAFLWSTYALTHGREVPVSGFNIMFSLPVVAVVLVVLALPIYRYRKELNQLVKNMDAASAQRNSSQALVGSAASARVKRIDPFYAVRVLLLAKATAIAGAIFVGWHLGVTLIQLSAPVVSTGVWFNLATAVGALASIGVALWVESICKIPDDPDETAKSKVQLGSAPDAALGRVRDTGSER